MFHEVSCERLAKLSFAINLWHGNYYSKKIARHACRNKSWTKFAKNHEGGAFIGISRKRRRELVVRMARDSENVYPA